MHPRTYLNALTKASYLRRQIEQTIDSLKIDVANMSPAVIATSPYLSFIIAEHSRLISKETKFYEALDSMLTGFTTCPGCWGEGGLTGPGSQDHPEPCPICDGMGILETYLHRPLP